MGVVFVEGDVGPGGHLAGRHQLLLDVPAGETHGDTAIAKLFNPSVKIFADMEQYQVETTCCLLRMPRCQNQDPSRYINITPTNLALGLLMAS